MFFRCADQAIAQRLGLGGQRFVEAGAWISFSVARPAAVAIGLPDSVPA